MAINEARPFPIAFNRTASSLQIERNGINDRALLGHVSTLPADRPRPIRRLPKLQRARSSVDLNRESQLVRYSNDQITPASPEGHFARQAEVGSQLFRPCRPSRSKFVGHDIRLSPSRYQFTEEKSDCVTLQSTNGLENPPKPLQSPIHFDPDVGNRDIDHSSEEISQSPSDSDQRPSQEDTMSFNSLDWELGVPRRRLSYGEPLELLKAKSTPEISASRGILGKTRWLSEDKDCESWVEDTIKARAARPFYSEPPRRKSRLWLNLVNNEEEEEQIEEAVSPTSGNPSYHADYPQQATTVTSSPTKPRVIEIPRRRAATISSSDVTTPSAQGAAPYPGSGPPDALQTPPQTPYSSVSEKKMTGPIDRAPFPPIGLGIDTGEDSISNSCPTRVRTSLATKKALQNEVFNRIRSRTTWTSTPGSHLTPLRSTETVRRIEPADLSLQSPRSFQGILSLNEGIKLSDTNRWILTELEAALVGQAAQPLHLSLPVIQQICLPPAQRRNPASSPPVIPQSKYAITKGPLTSHRFPFHFVRPLQQSPSNHNNGPRVCTGTDNALSILRRIFAAAKSTALCSLLATTLALNFTTSMQPQPKPDVDALGGGKPSSPRIHVCPPSYNSALPAPPSYHPVSKTATEPTPDSGLEPSISSGRRQMSLPDHIPSKARAMLGLAPPSSRPPLPAFWRRAEQREWAERISELEEGLWRFVKKGVVGCLGLDRVERLDRERGHGRGRDEEGDHDALVRAVVEIVKRTSVCCSQCHCGCCCCSCRTQIGVARTGTRTGSGSASASGGRGCFGEGEVDGER